MLARNVVSTEADVACIFEIGKDKMERYSFEVDVTLVQCDTTQSVEAYLFLNVKLIVFHSANLSP